MISIWRTRLVRSQMDQSRSMRSPPTKSLVVQANLLAGLQVFYPTHNTSTSTLPFPPSRSDLSSTWPSFLLDSFPISNRSFHQLHTSPSPSPSPYLSTCVYLALAYQRLTESIHATSSPLSSCPAPDLLITFTLSSSQPSIAHHQNHGAFQVYNL